MRLLASCLASRQAAFAGLTSLADLSWVRAPRKPSQRRSRRAGDGAASSPTSVRLADPLEVDPAGEFYGIRYSKLLTQFT